MTGLLADLAAGRTIRTPVALVLAHPDDEVVSLGSRLNRFADLTLIYVTDGAPRDLSDARRAGFGDWQAYAAAREAELQGALALLGVSARRIGYGIADQDSAAYLGGIVERLRADLHGVGAVFTHPYEHGHPDHDSAALAVAQAAPGLARFEFASYHLGASGARFLHFWPDPSAPETVLHLSPAERAEKAAAMACFASQRETLSPIPLAAERVRPAPVYDFTRPAPPGATLYEHWGFRENAAAWRARAAQAIEPAWA